MDLVDLMGRREGKVEGTWKCVDHVDLMGRREGKVRGSRSGWTMWISFQAIVDQVDLVDLIREMRHFTF